jgi:hypothetical protein
MIRELKPSASEASKQFCDPGDFLGCCLYASADDATAMAKTKLLTVAHPLV